VLAGAAGGMGGLAMSGPRGMAPGFALGLAAAAFLATVAVAAFVAVAASSLPWAKIAQAWAGACP
jgi:hypothetical protein